MGKSDLTTKRPRRRKWKMAKGEKGQNQRIKALENQLAKVVERKVIDYTPAAVAAGIQNDGLWNDDSFFAPDTGVDYDEKIGASVNLLSQTVKFHLQMPAASSMTATQVRLIIASSRDGNVDLTLKHILTNTPPGYNAAQMFITPLRSAGAVTQENKGYNLHYDAVFELNKTTNMYQVGKIRVKYGNKTNRGKEVYFYGLAGADLALNHNLQIFAISDAANQTDAIVANINCRNIYEDA